MPDLVTEIFVGSSDPLMGYERYAAANWDGYGADAISPETLAAARRFFRMLPATFGAPEIAPGSNGTIALEWSFKNKPLRKLFIDIGPGQIWSAYWRRATGEKSTLPRKPIRAGTKDVLTKLFQQLNT
jgi:hypothetical protein